jgi:multiple sugar transport system permease protein
MSSDTRHDLLAYRRRIERQRMVRDVGLHVLVVAVMVPILFPFYWLAVSALQEPANLISIPPRLVPKQLSLHYVRVVFGQLGMGRFLFNSVYISLLTMFLTAVLAALAAYSHTVYSYRGRETASKLVLFVYMFPQILVVIPLYILLTRTGLINTHHGLILAMMAFELPVGIWVLQAYFETIPRDLLDAANIDGLSKLRALWYVYVPVSLPGLAASAVMTFIGVWNNYLLPNTFLIQERLRTLPVVIADYNSREGSHIGEVLAASLIVAIPSFLFALFAQRYLVGGLTAGATKG